MHAELWVTLDGAVVTRSVLRPGQVFVVGRTPDATLQVDDPRVSRRHATLELREDGLYVVDLGSRNGSFVGRERLTARTPRRLAPSEALQLGRHLLRVELVGLDDDRTMEIVSDREADQALLDPAELELLEQVGVGAQGRVWAAREHALGRRVAVKLLHRDLAGRLEERERFLREARVCARLNSPHVVTVYGARVVDDRPLIIMELVEGPTALDLLRDGPLPLRAALDVACGVAEALAAACAAGVVHRDVKPSNVFLAAGGRPKLGDFGIAKQVGTDGLTQTGIGLGSLAYAAPEQVLDAKAVDGRADVYGLGATLYHLLGGYAPFAIDAQVNVAEAVRRVTTLQPPRLRALRAEVPADLEALVHAMLAKAPADRPSSAREALRALSTARERAPAPDGDADDEDTEDLPARRV